VKRAAIHAFIIASIAVGTARAADSPGSSPGEARDPALEQARAAIAAGNWGQAQQVLREAVATDPRNADYHSLFAHAVRKGPNPDLEVVGNLAKAKEHLAALDRLCFLPCEEYTVLMKAVARFEAKQKR